MDADGTRIDFPELVDWLGHDMLSIDLRTRRLLYVSPSAAVRLGGGRPLPPDVELRGEVLTGLLTRLFPDEATRVEMAALLDGDRSEDTYVSYRIIENGSVRWRRARTRIVGGTRLDVLSTDITELVTSQRATARVQALQQIVEAMHAAPSLKDACTVGAELIRALLDVSRCVVLVFDEVASSLDVVRSVAGRGTDGPLPPTSRALLGALVEKYGRLAQFPDVLSVPDLPHREHVRAMDMRSMAMASIGTAREPLGLLTVSTIGVARTFDEEEMRVLEGVAEVLSGPLLHQALEDQRRATAARIEAAEERLRAALEATATGIWEFDPVSGAVHWDERCHQLWEFDPKEPPSREATMSRVHPEDRPRLVEENARARDPSGTGAFSVEYRYLAPSGLKWLAARGRYHFDTDRSPRRFLGTIMDTTAQHRVEEARLATERRYREMIETMAEGVMVIDPSLLVRFVNPAACRMFGARSETGLVGEHVENLLFREEGEPTNALDATERDPLGRTLRRLRGRDGREILASVASVPLREHDGLSGTLWVITDVTESRRLESKLLSAQKLESLGVLAGGIAHDFNNLLVGVLGNAGLARSDLPPESRAHEAIDDIETAAMRASELTRQLLAYAGKARFVIGKIDPRRLVEEMGHLLSAVIGKGVVLRYQFGNGVPPIEGDATQLRQVVMNLITNASDAIGERSGIITVATSLLEVDRAYLKETLLDDELSPGYYVCLQVSDTGMGMSNETQARIFEPFFSTKFTGRGLGLAAVLGIMRGHRGAIKVYSELGRGTTFKMLLPPAEGTADVREAGPPVEAHPDSGTILVVDDEDTVRSVMKRILVRAGYTVLTAEDGIEGVAAFRAHRQEIRAVILDVTMPRMGGEEAYRQLRQIDPEVRVLLASGYSEQEATSQFAGKGLMGFVEKPFTPQTLLEKVRITLAPRPPQPS